MVIAAIILGASTAAAQVTSAPGFSVNSAGHTLNNLGSTEAIDHDFDVRGRMSRQRATGNPAEIGEAQAFAKRINVACDVADARMMTRSGRSLSYEVACKDGWDWVLTQGADGKAQAYDCLALSSSVKAAGGSVAYQGCQLPANRQPVQQLRTFVEKARITCKIKDGAWLGGGGDPPISRYEMRCEDGSGYLIDSPQPGSKADLSITNCKDAAAFGLKCSLPGGKG